MSAPELDVDNTWVISDTHFGHENIVDFCRRPADFEEIIVKEWAEAVPDTATVLHLGDLSYRNNSYFKNIIAPLLVAERKILVLGNHDKQRPAFYRDSGFRVAKPFDISYLGHIIEFSHYPWKERHNAPYRIRVHGHIHNNGYGGKESPFVPFSWNQINVSVEQTHYRPVNLKCLLDGHILGCYEPDKEPALVGDRQ